MRAVEHARGGRSRGVLGAGDGMWHACTGLQGSMRACSMHLQYCDLPARAVRRRGGRRTLVPELAGCASGAALRSSRVWVCGACGDSDLGCPESWLWRACGCGELSE